MHRSLPEFHDFHIDICARPLLTIPADAVIKKQAAPNVLRDDVFATEGRFVIRPGTIDANPLGHRSLVLRYPLQIVGLYVTAKLSATTIFPGSARSCWRTRTDSHPLSFARRPLPGSWN